MNWVPDLPAAGEPYKDVFATPAVVGGVVYVGSNTGVFYAIDESTGSVLWKRSLGYVTKKTCGPRGITSSATVVPAPGGGPLTVYVAGGDGHLYALSAATGNVVWRSFIVATGTTVNAGYDWSSPTVIDGHVYVGIASQCDNPLVRGGLREYDQATGAKLHTYWTVPKGAVGGGIWTTAASDGTDVWVVTGNADESGAEPGDSFSIVRLSASTLVVEDRWTVPGVLGTDLDWGSSPTLFRATINGVSTQMVGACNKNARFYAFAAADLSAGPMWSRKVGTSGLCLAAAVWDQADRLLIVSSNATTVGGTAYGGSVRGLRPATGRIAWELGVPEGAIQGTPTLNGSGVLAAATYEQGSGSTNALYVIEAKTGSVDARRNLSSPEFAQPVFANSYLFSTTLKGGVTALAPS